MILVKYSKDKQNQKLKRKIVELEKTAWDVSDDFPSAKNTYVTSFVVEEDDKAICHVGIRKATFELKGEEYTAYGLSEVITHPNYRKRGLASKAISEARKFIIEQNPDIIIFTCSHENIDFYTKNGMKIAKSTHLVGGTKAKPFRSDSLNLTTLIDLISPKANAHKKDFENTDITLELGEGQLW